MRDVRATAEGPQRVGAVAPSAVQQRSVWCSGEEVRGMHCDLQRLRGVLAGMDAAGSLCGLVKCLPVFAETV